MKRTALVLGIAVLLSGPAVAAEVENIDWNKVPTRTIKLFYPGMSSYQWLRSPAHKNAQAETLEGQACLSCHMNEEELIGNKMVSGERAELEDFPLEGKSGVIPLSVQAAHDSENLYFRFQWDTDMDRQGNMHDYMRFDGSDWKFWGSHRATATVIAGEVPPIYEDRLAIMIDDGTVPMFAEQGCWLTCHDTMRNMPMRPDAQEVKDHEFLGADGLKKSDIRKFLPASRDDEEASWDTVLPPEEIAELKAGGQFVDLMQWRVARSNPVGMADDGYVLEYRLFDAGKNPFSWNVDRGTMIPKFMFDEAKVGFKALTEENYAEPGKAKAMVKEENAVPYDEGAGFQEGDILPGRLLSRAGAEGSAADNDWAKGTWENGTYTLVFRRKLDTGHPEDDKILEIGKVYTIGLAVHDDNVTTRFHHVSFPLKLGIGTKGDIQAVTLD